MDDEKKEMDKEKITNMEDLASYVVVGKDHDGNDVFLTSPNMDLGGFAAVAGAVLSRLIMESSTQGMIKGVSLVQKK